MVAPEDGMQSRKSNLTYIPEFQGSSHIGTLHCLCNAMKEYYTFVNYYYSNNHFEIHLVRKLK